MLLESPSLVQQRVVGMNDLMHLHRCHLRLVIIVDWLKRRLGVRGRTEERC